MVPPGLAARQFSRAIQQRINAGLSIKLIRIISLFTRRVFVSGVGHKGFTIGLFQCERR
ncbi:hypothetical protein [Gynuella sunshinyii]|uniref:Uncharacterized protein n=1 Tax=Gynuella sunshinyii YC6258 TaxID=1445510 RepID=A0A0C5VHK5_9GAMM|nr:hypothetical protein [Gynuella sunshinyii]AJQ94152.1 hypothetical Protein YC6258_02110 [Gynuella sunshinyii YC6258]